MWPKVEFAGVSKSGCYEIFGTVNDTVNGTENKNKVGEDE